MKLIVGLGNPGTAYSHNRHNIGFMCLSYLAKEIGARFERKEGLSRTAHGQIDSTEVILARPQTYMNSSGKAVRKLVARYRLSLDDLIVIHDDLDLRLGQIRIRENGSSAGHKGIGSIISELGSADFIRVRIGVGRPEPDSPGAKQDAVVGYVLDDFTPEEGKVMAKVIPRVSQAVITIVNEGLDTAMNRFNSPLPHPELGV